MKVLLGMPSRFVRCGDGRQAGTLGISKSVFHPGWVSRALSVGSGGNSKRETGPKSQDFPSSSKNNDNSEALRQGGEIKVKTKDQAEQVQGARKLRHAEQTVQPM